MSKLKKRTWDDIPDGIFKNAEDTWIECGLLPSELLEMTEKSIAIQNETGNEKRKLQQQNQELIQGLKSAVKFVQVLEENGHITDWTGKKELENILEQALTKEK